MSVSSDARNGGKRCEKWASLNRPNDTMYLSRQHVEKDIKLKSVWYPTDDLSNVQGKANNGNKRQANEPVPLQRVKAISVQQSAVRKTNKNIISSTNFESKRGRL